MACKINVSAVVTSKMATFLFATNVLSVSSFLFLFKNIYIYFTISFPVHANLIATSEMFSKYKQLNACHTMWTTAAGRIIDLAVIDKCLIFNHAFREETDCRS